MWLTEPIDYALAENAAAIAIRQLSGERRGWGELVAIAQKILSHADDVPRDDLSDLRDYTAAAALTAAARVLDAASDPRSELPGSDRMSLACLAAIAYGIGGNFASSKAILSRECLGRLVEPGAVRAVGRNADDPGAAWTLGPAGIAALALSSPALVPELAQLLPIGTAASDLVGRYDTFLTDGNPAHQPPLRDLITSCLREPDDPSAFFEQSLLRMARACLEQAFTLSAPSVIRENSTVAEEVLDKLVGAGYRVLLPPQHRALTDHRLLLSVDNALVSLPTSTGKTLLGSLVALQALGTEPGIVCYITPWVAAARQAADALDAIRPADSRLSRMIGGFDQEAPLEPLDRAEIVVATPERFDALLRAAPELEHLLRAVVFDESHLVESGSRGVRLEGLIGRLRLLQQRGFPFRLVFLSAVVTPDAAALSWLGVDSASALVDPWRPTARRLAVWADDGHLKWLSGTDVIQREGLVPGSVIGHRQMRWPEPRLNPTGTYQGQKAQAPLVVKNVAYLVESMTELLGTPILCVCSTKAQTRAMATAIAERLPLLEPPPPLIARAQGYVAERVPYLRALSDALGHGVAYHNSTVPHELRRLIEDAVSQRELLVVTATTTLAEGVDLPFRVTVLAEWLMWGDAGLGPVTPGLFANVAGRAGRAGSYTDGDTILYDNPVGEPGFTQRDRRRAFQRAFLLAPAPPTLKSAFEVTGDSPGADLRAALASQFLAAIPENEAESNLRDALREQMLAGRRNGGGSAIAEILRDAEHDLVGVQPHFAVSASPLALTPLGASANKTNFSPASVRRILMELQGISDDAGLLVVAGSFCRRLGDLPEQPHGQFKKVLTNSRTKLWVKPGDVELVVECWLSGQSPPEIFAALPIVRRSTRHPPFKEWLSGETPGPAWDEMFDPVVDFITEVVAGFLPWLFRACEALSGHVGGAAQGKPWRQWAEWLEQPADDEAPDYWLEG